VKFKLFHVFKFVWCADIKNNFLKNKKILYIYIFLNKKHFKNNYCQTHKQHLMVKIAFFLFSLALGVTVEGAGGAKIWDAASPLFFLWRKIQESDDDKWRYWETETRDTDLLECTTTMSLVIVGKSISRIPLLSLSLSVFDAYGHQFLFFLASCSCGIGGPKSPFANAVWTILHFKFLTTLSHFPISITSRSPLRAPIVILARLLGGWWCSLR